MGDTVKNDQAKEPKKSWFVGLNAEFKKIIWPDKESLIKQTIAVTASAVALGIIIALLDYVIRFGINLIIL